MLQHRHVWNDGTFSNWHDAKRTHTGKGPDGLYEDDVVFEEREFTPGTRAKKSVTPQYSFNEYGEEVVTTARVLTEGELFAREVEAAMKEVAELVKPLKKVA
jgi:hypothetical protein